MNNKLLLASFFILLTQFSQVAHARSNVNTWFGGWVGQKHSNKLLDASGWHYCYNNRGGSCGRRSMTIGKNKCTSWGVNVGVDFEIKKYIPGLKLSAKGSRSWSACNTRSETISCSPKVHYKGRAELFATARYGKMYVQGKEAFNYYDSNWNNALHACKTGYWRSSIKRVTKTGRCTGFSCAPDKKVYMTTCKPAKATVLGYWPEKRWSQCGYRRI